MADVLVDAQRWLDSLATRTDPVEAAQDAVWVIEQGIAELERLRAIEAAFDADVAPGDPCVLCGSYGPVSLVASKRGSFWLCEDATSCRARKGGAK